MIFGRQLGGLYLVVQPKNNEGNREASNSLRVVTVISVCKSPYPTISWVYTNTLQSKTKTVTGEHSLS